MQYAVIEDFTEVPLWCYYKRIEQIQVLSNILNVAEIFHYSYYTLAPGSRFSKSPENVSERLRYVGN